MGLFRRWECPRGCGFDKAGHIFDSYGRLRTCPPPSMTGPMLAPPAPGPLQVRVSFDHPAPDPVTITKGDTIRIIPDKGPERVMLVAHVEHYVITLADPSGKEEN